MLSHHLGITIGRWCSNNSIFCSCGGRSIIDDKFIESECIAVQILEEDRGTKDKADLGKIWSW